MKRWELHTVDRQWRHFITNDASAKDIRKAFKLAAEKGLAVDISRYELGSFERGAV